MNISSKTASSSSPTSRRRENVVGALARGLVILDALTQAASPLALAEISERSSLDASTCLRLLQVLVTSGFVARDSASKRYVLGPKGCVPLPLHHPIAELRRESHHILRGLHDRFGGAVALILFMFDERVIVEMVRGAETLSPFYETWLRSPLHASATGKLLLAGLSAADRDRLLGDEPYASFTPSTLTKRADLNRDLAQIDATGYAVAANDNIDGLTSIAAPIRWRDQPLIASISFVDRSNRANTLGIGEVGVALCHEAQLFGRTAHSIRTVSQLLGR